MDGLEKRIIREYALTGCDTMKWFLCFRPSESLEGRKVLVELDRMVLSSINLSTSWYTFLFRSSLSGTHSCTSVAPFTTSSRSCVPAAVEIEIPEYKFSTQPKENCFSKTFSHQPFMLTKFCDLGTCSLVGFGGTFCPSCNGVKYSSTLQTEAACL